MNDPTDAATIPPKVRVEVRNALDIEVRRILAEHGLSLDLFGRLELVDLVLAEFHERLDHALPRRH